MARRPEFLVITVGTDQLAAFRWPGLLGTPTIPAVTEQQVFDMTRKTYGGPLLIGEDLMAFRLDADQVVHLPARKP